MGPMTTTIRLPRSSRRPTGPPAGTSRVSPGGQIAAVAGAPRERRELEVFAGRRQLEQLDGEVEVSLVRRKLEMTAIQPAHLGGRGQWLAHVLESAVRVDRCIAEIAARKD